MIGGLKWAGEEQRSLLAAVLASGNAPSSPAGQQEYNELRQIAEEASRHSIFSPAMVAKAFPNILGLTDVPYQEAKPFLLPVTRFAETSQIIGNAQGKNVSIEESAAAAIRVAHNLGILDPKLMAPVLKDMLVGQLTTGVSPAALEKI